MTAELLHRRSRTPTSLYTRRPRSPQKTLRPESVPAYTRPPSSLHVFSSFTTPEITDLTLSCQQSAVDNHTDKFTLKSCDSALLVRRGNTVVLKIVTSVKLSCPYVVSLTFVPVHRPRDRFGQFRARGVAHESHDLWLSITLPANFPIGKYHAHISLSLGSEVITHFHHTPVVVLFNPWNPEDASYLENSDHIDAYLLSDVGDICRGTVHNKTLRKWEYGQFEDCCLDVALYLLHSLSADECRNPVTVTRAVVSQVNPRDNTGVMVGSFSGSYLGGIHPCRWNGSTAILQKFHRTKVPVRYGQCWVFAGVCITLLRALGLACRPVTCYNAAHQCNKLGQVDRHFTTDGELLDDPNNDHIWVYHVWVEVWMTRNDLSPDHNGWQVVDATAQTKQSGVHRIGPVPVTAIKEKKFDKQLSYFGGEYILSEVTADTRYLRFGRVANRPSTVAQVRHDEVGSEVVTMAIDEKGSLSLTTITTDYRDVIADSPSTHTHPTHFPPPTRDCTFHISTNDGIVFGETIQLSVKIKNCGAMLRTVDGRVIGHVTYYNGQVVRKFMNMQFTGAISPGQDATVSLPIEAKQYTGILTEQCILQFFIAIKVRESRQLFLKTHPFQICVPPIEIECPSTIVEGGTARVKLKFKNILKCSMSRVLFLVQGGQLCPHRELASKRIVLPGQTVCVEFCLRASCCHGDYMLIASLHSEHLTDVHGHTHIQVTPRAHQE